MAGEVIDSAEGYEPDLRGRFPAAVPIGVAGLDIVRAPDGTLTVLEDNVRTPSGFTYALAARRRGARRPAGRRPRPGRGRRRGVRAASAAC